MTYKEGKHPPVLAGERDPPLRLILGLLDAGAWTRHQPAMSATRSRPAPHREACPSEKGLPKGLEKGIPSAGENFPYVFKGARSAPDLAVRAR
jgi:hypothetical protein